MSIHLRLTRLLVAPASVMALADGFEDAPIVEPRAAEGWVGCGLLFRRETGEIVDISQWESDRALAASEMLALRARAQAPSDLRGFRVIDVARLELAHQDRRARTAEAAFVRIDVGWLPADRIDAFGAFIASDLIPDLRRLDGYETTMIAVEHTAGLVAVFTEWRTEAERKAADPAFLPVLRRAAEFSMQPIEIQLWERPARRAVAEE